MASTRKPASGRDATLLLSSAPTWLMASHRKPSSNVGAGAFPAGGQGEGLGKDTAAYRAGLNCFSAAELAGIVIPTHASPC